MRTVSTGLREGALTLAYNAILFARRLVRRATRPTEMGVRVLVVRGDELLLVRHRGGRTPWSLPGGGIAPRETLAEAAAREVREEAGCAVTVGALLGLYHSFGEGMNNYIAIFVATPHEAAQAPSGDLEIVDARFFARRDLPANTDPASLRRVAEYDAGEQGVYRAW